MDVHKIKKDMVEAVILRGSYLWDGINNKLISDGAVLVNQGIIKAVGKASEIMSAPHSRVFEWKGATLLPGLIDCHTHLSMDPEMENYLDHMSDSVAEQTLRATAMMRKDLFAGITTTRCCGDKEFLDIACKKAVQNGLVEGPGLIVATRGIRAPDGHGFVGYPIEGARNIISTIKENIERGADFIKFYVTGTLKGNGDLPSYLSREMIRLIIDEAHKAGVKSAAHCVGGVGLDLCLQFGLDTLEHAYHITDKQIEKLAASDTWLILTPSPLLTESRVRHLPEGLIPGHLEEKDEIASRMAAAIKAKLNFAVGTDGMHGGLAQEVAYLVELGASPETVLKAATINGATVCGMEHRIGSLEAGKYADVIAVNGNPLQDINVLKKVVAVLKQGHLVFNSN